MVHCHPLCAKPPCSILLALPISRWKALSRVSQALCNMLLFTITASRSSPNSVLRTIISGPQKGPVERGHVKKCHKKVKKCQKYFRHFSTFFAQGKKTSKIVKKCQKYFRHFSTLFARHQFSGPFREALKSDAREWGIGFVGVGSAHLGRLRFASNWGDSACKEFWANQGQKNG